MNNNAERLCCYEDEAVEYFELLDIRHGWARSESLKLPVKQFVFSKVVDSTLLNLDTCKTFKPRCSVLEADLRLSQWSSWWH